jgi:hypothetical protein
MPDTRAGCQLPGTSVVRPYLNASRAPSKSPASVAPDTSQKVLTNEEPIVIVIPQLPY